MTITAARDVNAEFAAQKITQLTREADQLKHLNAQVEKGEMSKRENADGSITFTVLQGWDRNETFTVRANTKVEANHGLDLKENGDVALYLKDKPAWHALGTVIPGGLSTASAVLRAGGINFEVEKVPALYSFGDTIREAENSFITLRKDTGASLGMVGNQYTPFQNHEAYGMLGGLLGLGMVAESAGSLSGGRRVFVTAEIPESLRIDPNGVNDEIKQYLAILNSHDGKTPITAIVTPWRVVCRNTERLAVKGAKTKWTVRHTVNAKERIEEAKQSLGLTIAYYEAFAKEETALLHTPLKDIDALIDDIWEMKADAPKRAVTLSAQRREILHEIYGVESERVGRNAYAFERAVTGYVDHFSELRPRGELKGNRLAALGHALMSETLDEKKTTAHKRLMQLVTR